MCKLNLFQLMNLQLRQTESILPFQTFPTLLRELGVRQLLSIVTVQNMMSPLCHCV